MNKTLQYIHRFAAAILLLLPLCSCGGQDEPDNGGGQSAPEGMVEVCPILPGMFSDIPRDPATIGRSASRYYPSVSETNAKLTPENTITLPEGSTVWLIAQSGNTYIQKSYVVHNPDDKEKVSYLVPCKVNKDGEMISMEGTPLYLKNNTTYKFYAISPARELTINGDQIGFKVKNGEAFYANDSRYTYTTPTDITVKFTPGAEVQKITLNPMINQTAQLKFQINRGNGVHDLDIQPSGIEVAGLQDDENGIDWHMSLYKDEPIELKHGGKFGSYTNYDYRIEADESVSLEVPVLPMWSISKPVIILFRLKINGVPTAYEMMLNEKDFKAGYSYGYRGTVNIENNVSVITWQYISWGIDAPLIPDSPDITP